MGIIERKQRQKDEVRTAILSAAWKLVANEGWQSLSIRKIADAIEYSAPVIYDHFENKEAILLEFTRKGFQLLDAQVKTAAAKFEDPADQLKAMAHAYWDFALEHRQYYYLMYGVGMPTCEMTKEIIEVKGFSQTLIDAIEALTSRNGNKSVNAILKMRTYWSMLHGLVTITMMSEQLEEHDMNRVVLDDMIAGFISGIRK